jgi:hypothetical protein
MASTSTSFREPRAGRVRMKKPQPEKVNSRLRPNGIWEDPDIEKLLRLSASADAGKPDQPKRAKSQ